MLPSCLTQALLCHICGLHFGLRLEGSSSAAYSHWLHRLARFFLSSTAYCLRHCLCQLCVSISLASPHCQGLKCRFPALRFCSNCGLPLLLHLRSSGSASLAFFRLCSNCCPPALQNSASVLSPLCNRRKKTPLDLIDQNDRLTVRTGKRYKATCHRSMPAAVPIPAAPPP